MKNHVHSHCENNKNKAQDEEPHAFSLREQQKFKEKNKNKAQDQEQHVFPLREQEQHGMMNYMHISQNQKT